MLTKSERKSNACRSNNVQLCAKVILYNSVKKELITRKSFLISCANHFLLYKKKVVSLHIYRLPGKVLPAYLLRATNSPLLNSLLCLREHTAFFQKNSSAKTVS